MPGIRLSGGAGHGILREVAEVTEDDRCRYFAGLLRRFGFKVAVVTAVGRLGGGRFEVWYRTGGRLTGRVVDIRRGGPGAEEVSGAEEGMAVLSGAIRVTPEGERVRWRLEKSYTVLPFELLGARPTGRELGRARAGGPEDEIAGLVAD